MKFILSINFLHFLFVSSNFRSVKKKQNKNDTKQKKNKEKSNYTMFEEDFPF